jgi:uracil phosphoribosyltransferase
MIIHDFSKKNSLLNLFITSLRDKIKQKDSIFFRRNLERIGEVFAYEISKTLIYQSKFIVTPFAEKEVFLPLYPVVVSSILRAGIPLHQGILNYFDTAASSFVTPFYRNQDGVAQNLKSYASKTNIDNTTLIIADPMLATGASMIEAYDALLQLKEKDNPVSVHFVVVVASPEGLQKMQEVITENNTHIWVLSVDSHLNDQGYIVPGLGDAGDLSFGGLE